MDIFVFKSFLEPHSRTEKIQNPLTATHEEIVEDVTFTRILQMNCCCVGGNIFVEYIVVTCIRILQEFIFTIEV